MSADFRGKGTSPTNHNWYQSSRVIALSCGIKISAVRHLVFSQSTRVTDEQTNRQNYDSQDRPRICSRGKNEWKQKQYRKKKLKQKVRSEGNYLLHQRHVGQNVVEYFTNDINTSNLLVNMILQDSDNNGWRC